MTKPVIVVAGGGGFIGGHLVRRLCAEGHRVRAVDHRRVEQWHQRSRDAENLVLDLRSADACDRAVDNASGIYNLAADMGGIGFIESNKSRCMLSVVINAQLLQAAVSHDVERYFFSSSACVYASDKQLTTQVRPLRETDA